MPSILVVVDRNGVEQSSVLTSAGLLARSLGGSVEGAAMKRPDVNLYATEGMVLTDDMLSDGADFVVQSQKAFEAHFTAFKVQHRWHSERAIGQRALGSLARVYDFTVLDRPWGSNFDVRMTTLETALFESGQPVLVAPPTPPTTLGENVVISWNCSTEQARATASAIPLLKTAKAVTILTIEGLTVSGPTGDECRDWLVTHGIDARHISMGNGGRKPGEVLLNEAQKLGADLIVKGAYTQSRLRQLIFGGATSHLLAHSHLPMLMAR